MTSMVSEEFKRRCRTCLTTNGEMVSIFSDGLYVENLPNKIMASAKVEITEHDGLPNMICKKCVFLADSFYCFKKQCESAESTLKSMAKSQQREKSNRYRARIKLDSESSHKSNRTGISITTSSDEKSGKRTSSSGQRERNISESFLESEDEYTVEYISDDVRIEVENALKRKREAQKRVSMEKLSQSIKNLKGIEVVPIRNGRTAHSSRFTGMQKEEIVVFPVRQVNKIGPAMPRQANRREERSLLKSNVIEMDNTEDYPLHYKRSRLETSEVNVDADETMKNDSLIVYGKNKKLHFSTVRKVVRIDDEALFVDLKDEHTDRENENGPTEDQEIIEIDDDSYENVGNENENEQEAENLEEQMFDLQEDTEQIEQTTNSEIQEMQVYHLQSDLKQVDQCLGVQILKFQDGERIIELHESQQFSENQDEQNVQIDEGDEISQDVIIIGSEEEPEEEKFYFHPDMAEDDVEVLAQEFQQIQRRSISESLSNNTGISEGCITSASNEQNVGNDNAADEAVGIITSYQDAVDNSEIIIADTADNGNEVFIENEIPNDVNMRVDDVEKNAEAAMVEPMKMETSEIRNEILPDKETQNGEQKEDIDMSLESSEDLTSLTLVGVNLSAEREQGANLQGYKTEVPAEDEVRDYSDLKNEPLVSNYQERSFCTNMKFYQCTICKVNFATMPAVLKHNIQEHMTEESVYSCLICEKTFEDKSSLCLHVEEHNGLRPYRCTFCPKTYTLMRNLKRHVNHHIHYKTFQCHICMKRFSEKSSLRSHMYLHTGDSPFSCKACNVSFNNKANWRRHVTTIHEKLTLIVCKYCNKELPDKRSLQTHIRTHTGDRPFQCPHCDKRFSQQCNLNTHIHCHLNDRPFLCPHCEKGFNQRGTRDDHVLTHTGEKPHKCTECSAGFTVSSALKRHMWIHTDKDKPYNCSKCKLQFVGLYDLRRHLRVRHDEILRPENPRVERMSAMEVLKQEVEKIQCEDISVAKTESDECEITDEIVGGNRSGDDVGNSENIAKPELGAKQEVDNQDTDKDSNEIDMKLTDEAMKTEENI